MTRSFYAFFADWNDRATCHRSRRRFGDRIDQPFHFVVGTHSGIQLIADKERGSGVHPSPQTIGEIGVDARLIFAAVVTTLPLGQIRHTDLARVAPKKGLRHIGRFTIPLILRLKDSIVHLPELSLLIRAGGGVGCSNRVAVLGEREIVIGKVGEPRVDNAGTHIGLSDCRETRTRRTLEIGVFEDLYRGLDFADDIALSWPSVGRVGHFTNLGRPRFGLPHYVRERGDANEYNDAEHPPEGLWPTCCTGLPDSVSRGYVPVTRLVAGGRHLKNLISSALAEFVVTRKLREG